MMNEEMKMQVETLGEQMVEGVELDALMQQTLGGFWYEF